MSSIQPPSVGRIVHYRDQGNEPPQAAIVVGVVKGKPDDDNVNLTVFSTIGSAYSQVNVPYTDDPENTAGRCWTWPPAVPARAVAPVDDAPPTPETPKRYVPAKKFVSNKKDTP